MKQHLWKVVEFSGWFVLLVGIIFGLLYSTLIVGEELYGGILLLVLGAIMVLIGEMFLEKHGRDHKLHMVWQAVSMGGAFSLTVGIVWLIIQFMQTYQSWFSVIILLAIGLGLIAVGEGLKIEKHGL